jgi:exopolysaccharide production protein ExoZ
MMRAGPPSPKIVGIQALRGLAACGVVLCHMTGFETKYLAGPTILPGSFRFGMVGVDLFFVLSGFIMTSMSLGKFGRPGEAGRFLKRRFLRVYPIYWAWSVPVLALFLIRPDMVNSSHGRPDVLRSFLLLPQDHLPLLLVAWTLVYEIFFYLLFSAGLRWLRETDLPWALGGWAAVVIAGNWLVLPGKMDPMLGLMFSPLLLEFMMGCVVALCVSRFNGTAAIMAMTLGTGGFVFGTIIYLMHGGWFPSDWDRTLVYGTSSATLLAGVVAWERVQGQPVLPSLAGLGDASYSLYLSHVPVIAAAGLVCRRLLPTALPAAHLAALLAAFAVALLAGFASFRLVESPLLRLSQRLSFDAVWRLFTADVMFAPRRVAGLLRVTH